MIHTHALDQSPQNSGFLCIKTWFNMFHIKKHYYTSLNAIIQTIKMMIHRFLSEKWDVSHVYFQHVISWSFWMFTATTYMWSCVLIHVLTGLISRNSHTDREWSILTLKSVSNRYAVKMWSRFWKTTKIRVFGLDRTLLGCSSKHSHIEHPHKHFEVPKIDIEGNFVEISR